MAKFWAARLCRFASAGIGGGCNGRGGKITIIGGEVHAYGGDNGAGIGGGVNGDSGDITISGGLVEAVGGTLDLRALSCPA